MSENVFLTPQKEYRVADTQLAMRALPFNRLQKALKIVTEAFQELDKQSHGTGTELIGGLPGLMMGRFTELMPILFDEKLYPFITKEWVEEHVTFPLALQILQDAVAMNQVNDFFGGLKALGQASQAREEATPTKA